MKSFLPLSVISAAAIVGAAPACAGTITFTFEDQTSFSSLTYPAGANSGIVANGALQALANDSAGPYFDNSSVPAGGSFVMFATTPLAGERADFSLLPSMGWFANSISFYYSATANTTVYARAADGSVLQSFALAADDAGSYSSWKLANFNFSFTGHAASIDFSDTAGVAAFDNVTVSAVPEPSSALLLPLGVVALHLLRRRRQAGRAV